MSDFFSKPDPKQAVPGDLKGTRGSILDILTGNGARAGGLLGNLQGLGSDETPGGDVLGPLRAVSDQRLNDQISQLNSSGGRFSTGNLFGSMDLRQRSQQDFNLLGSQVLERGRDRQLQAIMALLGPVLGPTFGGPFTQNASGFENFLGLLNAGSNFLPTPKAGGRA